MPPHTESSLRLAGRLAHFVNAWKVLTKDSWELQAVKAFQILSRATHTGEEAKSALAQIQKKVFSLLEKKGP